jgi:hypothetical protein
MKESVAVAKEADAKKGVSPIKSDKSIHRARHEPERQLGSLRGVIGNIRRDGGKPSVDGIATELGSMSSAQRAPVLLALQQTHGNRYVQRVVAGIQAKLKVGQPGDKYEQEADKVADAVMLIPEPQEESLQKAQLKAIGIQHAYSESKAELLQNHKDEEENIIQAQELNNHAPQDSSALEIQIQSLYGRGQSLPEYTRTFFESRFGYDFGHVRVHTNDQAEIAAKTLNAQAFTIGHNIIFGAGRYSPENTDGRRLLAHELTHAIQQGSVTEKQKLRSTSPEITAPGHNRRENYSTLERRLSINAESRNQFLIQRQIMIGSGYDQHQMTDEERDSIFAPGYCDPLVIQADYESASRIVEDMERSSEELLFRDINELRAEVIRRIQGGQGTVPREMVDQALSWLIDNNISYTMIPRGAARFRNAIALDFSQVVSGFNLHDGRGRVSNIHPVTPRLAVALVRLIRHLHSEGVTTLHHVGVSEGTHAEIGYAIDIRGFTFSDGTTILLPPAFRGTMIIFIVRYLMAKHIEDL